MYAWPRQGGRRGEPHGLTVHTDNARAPSGGGPLDRELGGDLRCARCRYNLRGLSVRNACPECALPVQATLLAVVDPRAREIQPIDRPRLVAAGLLLWSACALASALCIWTVRMGELASGMTGRLYAPGWLGLAAVGLCALSGLGLAALVRPHGGIPLRWRMMAGAGVVLYVPLVCLMGWLHLVHDPVREAPYISGPPAELVRSVVHAGACAMIAVIIGLVRPNLRLLVARSMLLRMGRVDRQTLIALAAVSLVSMLGDVVLWIAVVLTGHVSETAWTAGGVLILTGSMLFILGLVGVLVDAVRILPVVLSPPLSLTEVMSGQPQRPGPARGERA